MQGGLEAVHFDEKTMSVIPFRELLTQKTNYITGELISEEGLAAGGNFDRSCQQDTYSLTIANNEMRLFFANAKQESMYTMQGDCLAAYLNGCLKDVRVEPVYLFLSTGHPVRKSVPRKSYECPAARNGLTNSGRV